MVSQCFEKIAQFHFNLQTAFTNVFKCIQKYWKVISVYDSFVCEFSNSVVGRERKALSLSKRRPSIQSLAKKGLETRKSDGYCEQSWFSLFMSLAGLQ